ncbi:hypothetical protein PanWU01x14_220570 [Parasponia andersonii]|uniref:Uncharacterized protein n=1 Tax=Parasponia andersonii TaxID=3476 RepID=A0A2P5BPX0_PARAD|nr:hypothetical protein PanWU01x14_220570 [Parasponia andersonii]
MGITFVTLIDKLYKVIRVDKNRFDLELKVVYKCDGGDRIPIPSTKITSDSDLEIWLEEMSYSIQNRTSFCVSILPMLTPVGEGCSQNASFVPKTEGELPQGTPNNLSVGSSNSVKIVIGQLFENKEDLKLKLYLNLRARKVEQFDMFEMRRYVPKHTCSLAIRHKDNRQAAP